MLPSFKDMKVPENIIEALKNMGADGYGQNFSLFGAACTAD